MASNSPLEDLAKQKARALQGLQILETQFQVLRDKGYISPENIGKFERNIEHLKTIYPLYWELEHGLKVGSQYREMGLGGSIAEISKDDRKATFDLLDSAKGMLGMVALFSDKKVRRDDIGMSLQTASAILKHKEAVMDYDINRRNLETALQNMVTPVLEQASPEIRALYRKTTGDTDKARNESPEAFASALKQMREDFETILPQKGATLQP